VLGAPLGRTIVTVEVLSAVVVGVDEALGVCAEVQDMKDVASTAERRRTTFPTSILPFL
jgi:hypothetical protein